MTLDYAVSSLPPLVFGAPPPIDADKFREIAGESFDIGDEWRDLETQLRNAIAEARGGEKWKRPAKGCSVYWRGRIAECFQEKDPGRREDLVDKVFWDAAGTLASPSSPLGAGALKAYAARLRIALKRAKASKDEGLRLFENLTSGKNDNGKEEKK